MQQPDRATLSARQRMEIAKVSGAIRRLAIGASPKPDQRFAVAQLHRISRDPVVFGHVLGGILVEREQSSAPEWYEQAVALLRAVGVDEAAAAANVAWLRERNATLDGGFRL